MERAGRGGLIPAGSLTVVWAQHSGPILGELRVPALGPGRQVSEGRAPALPGPRAARGPTWLLSVTQEPGGRLLRPGGRVRGPSVGGAGRRPPETAP